MAKNTIQGGNPLEPVHGFDGLTTGEVIQSVALVKEGTDTPLPSHVTRGLVVDIAGSGVGDSIMVAGTGNSAPSTVVQLNAGVSQPCKAVILNAGPLNATRIAVGASSCDASDLGYRGLAFLDPGVGPVSFAVSNANVLYVDFLTVGDRLGWGVII